LGVCRNEARKWGVLVKPPKFARSYVDLLDQRGQNLQHYIRSEQQYIDLVNENAWLLECNANMQKRLDAITELANKILEESE
jgi:hypothetical protein